MKRTSAYLEYLLRTPSCTTVPGRVLPNPIEGGRNRGRFSVVLCEPIPRYPVISGSDDEEEYVQQEEEEDVQQKEEKEYDGEIGDEHNNHVATVMGTTCNSGEANEGAVQNEDDESATEAEVEDQDDDFVEMNDDDVQKVKEEDDIVKTEDDSVDTSQEMPAQRRPSRRITDFEDDVFVFTMHFQLKYGDVWVHNYHRRVLNCQRKFGACIHFLVGIPLPKKNARPLNMQCIWCNNKTVFYCAGCTSAMEEHLHDLSTTIESIEAGARPGARAGAEEAGAEEARAEEAGAEEALAPVAPVAPVGVGAEEHAAYGKNRKREPHTRSSRLCLIRRKQITPICFGNNGACFKAHHLGMPSIRHPSTFTQMEYNHMIQFYDDLYHPISTAGSAKPS